MDFADVRKVLEAYGWEQVRQKGSHVTFWKQGEARSLTLPIAHGNRVKGSYIRVVLIRLGLETDKE